MTTTPPKTLTETIELINAGQEAFLVAFAQLDAAEQVVVLDRYLALLAEVDAVYLKMREQMALAGIFPPVEERRWIRERPRFRDLC